MHVENYIKFLMEKLSQLYYKRHCLNKPLISAFYSICGAQCQWHPAVSVPLESEGISRLQLADGQ